MPPFAVMTVAGPVDPALLGITDAHQHAWIAPVAGAPPGGPRLQDRQTVAARLTRYRQAGGGSLLDCQPGGCGRDGLTLAGLAHDSSVHIVACTGFHLQRYYPPGNRLWQATAEKAHDYFVSEIRTGLAETFGTETLSPVQAGFIKIACTAELDRTPAALLEAAAAAARETGVALLAHTEQGRAAEEIVAHLSGYGLPAGRLVLCHIDKRPDAGLHRELAQGGVLLEYDTFFRPRYEPDRHVWPLLEQMVRAGLAGAIAIGTDMADLALWREIGPAGLVTAILPRLQALGLDQGTIRRLIGQNIAGRLVCRPAPSP